MRVCCHIHISALTLLPSKPGTYDIEPSDGTFAAGTLDEMIDPTILILIWLALDFAISMLLFWQTLQPSHLESFNDIALACLDGIIDCVGRLEIEPITLLDWLCEVTHPRQQQTRLENGHPSLDESDLRMEDKCFIPFASWEDQETTPHAVSDEKARVEETAREACDECSALLGGSAPPATCEEFSSDAFRDTTKCGSTSDHTAVKTHRRAEDTTDHGDAAIDEAHPGDPVASTLRIDPRPDTPQEDRIGDKTHHIQVLRTAEDCVEGQTLQVGQMPDVQEESPKEKVQQAVTLERPNIQREFSTAEAVPALMAPASPLETGETVATQGEISEVEREQAQDYAVMDTPRHDVAERVSGMEAASTVNTTSDHPRTNPPTWSSSTTFNRQRPTWLESSPRSDEEVVEMVHWFDGWQRRRRLRFSSSMQFRANGGTLDDV